MTTGLELFDRIRRRALSAPGRIAYRESASGRSIAYGQFLSRVESLSASLAGDVRDRVVMLRCGNRIEYPIWYVALLTCGATMFPVSIELTDTELQSLAAQTNALAIVGRGGILAQEYSIDSLGDESTKALDRTPSPGSMLLASSGTTGAPKVVRRDAASLDAVARNMVEAIGFTATDQVLAAVPLTHSYGVEHGLLAPLWAGSTVQLCDGLDWPSMTQSLRDATIFPAVPSMIEMLAASPDRSLAMPKLRTVYSAGGPLPRALNDRFADRFRLRVGQVYGMTEIGSVTYNDAACEPFDPASVGLAMRDVSIRVLATDGEDGEIVVRAPSMLSGYVNGDSPMIDGHFRTGDVGRLDTLGRLTISGRVRLLIDAGGMKINPLEVESVIGLHPDVVECVVVPVRQSETVQRICALIVPRDTTLPPTTESIRQFAKERLAAYKVPRLVQFRASLPRTAARKLQRHILEVT
ncbi:N/A [soil metagenome]